MERLTGKHLKARKSVVEFVDDEHQNRSNEDRIRPIQLVIGLDFGTSFSKVVVGEARVRYAVPFKKHAIGKSTLLLPSALCVLPGPEKCRLGIKERRYTLYDNLKMPLIERDFSDEVQLRVAAYLALVFRHTRQWLFNTHGRIYGGRKIEWFVNVGLPTDSYDDEELTSVYRRIVRGAWHSSMIPGDVTLQTVRDSLERASALSDRGMVTEEGVEPFLQGDRVSAFPEFVAQLAGYVRSPLRRDGLHVMVDVGGGTLDVTVFNVHQDDDEDVYPIFARRVVPLGVRNLLLARSQKLHRVFGEKYSPFDDLPSDADFRKRFGITEEELGEANKPFRTEVLRAITDQLWYTKKERYPGAPQWSLGLTLYGEPVPGFFGGGGALSEFYADLLRKFEEKPPPYRVSSRQLPIPSNLEAPGMTSTDYARLAVAYGLSFDPYDIGQVRRKADIEDVHAETSDWTFEDNYIGSEHV